MEKFNKKKEEITKINITDNISQEDKINLYKTKYLIDKESKNNLIPNLISNYIEINSIKSTVKLEEEEDYNKYNIINTELNDAKNVILNLQMENANIILEK